MHATYHGNWYTYLNLYRYHVASSVQVPLLDRRAIELLLRSLSPRDQALWGEMGANWKIPRYNKETKLLVFCHLTLLFSEQWPASNPLPNYEIIFADGCVPSSLHNISDRPSNFPTLDTLPRDRRPLDYSDAYDGSNEENTSNLRVNPMVEAAVANTASMVHSQFVPPKLATTWEAQHPTVSLLVI